METESTADIVATEVQFEINGTTLIYDFSLLTMAQMKTAEAIYAYQADLEKKPARTLKEKLQLGGADYDQTVLSHLLLRRLPNGEIEKYKGGETQQRILALVNEMPSGLVKKAEDVITDFFDRCERSTLRLLVQQKHALQYAELISGHILRTQQQMTSDASSKSEAQESELSTTSESGAEELGHA